MGIKSSKEIEDEQLAIVMLLLFKTDIEYLHRNYKIDNINMCNKLDVRRLDYADVLHRFYTRLKDDIISTDPEKLFSFDLRFKPFGFTVKVTKNNTKIAKYFINYSPYYLSGDNTENEIEDQIACPEILKEYMQYF
jgi:hypothetical protein